MVHSILPAIVLLFSLLAAGFQAQAAVGVRLILGVTDKQPVKWDGSVSARNARITSLEPWRFMQDDSISGTSWRVSTHPALLFGSRGRRPQVVANGVVVYLADERGNAELDVTTAQGNFIVRLSDIPFGTMQHVLDGKVMVDRIPSVTRLTNTPEEQDYPAAVSDKNGNVWVAYTEFRHNPNHDRLRAPLTEPLKDFSEMKAPTGGDQILLCRFSGGVWGAPAAVTNPGGDVYRPAVAVDGSGRVWVFWSSNEKNDFDVYARVIENGKPGATVRITSEPGSDIDPAVTTDAKGRVWVAWQGWRNGRAAIFAASQAGNGFSKPVMISNSPANEWNPAIAADNTGMVTVAWDSYRNGNYDVFMRSATAPGAWGKELPAAATRMYEAYPSIAYDIAGRLWVAYEEGAEKWGKDYGAYETTGVSIYQGRAVRLRGFEKNGRELETVADLSAALPGVPSLQVDSPDRQNQAVGWLQPNPDYAKNRRPSATPSPTIGSKNSMPRLKTDASGRLWLGFRSAQPIFWNPIGTVWSEYVVSYDGSKWTGPIFLSHSDNLLDNRPALVPVNGGGLMVVGSSDSRRQVELAGGVRAGQRKGAKKAAPGGAVKDPYNNDLFANLVWLPAASGPVAAKAGTAPRIAGPEAVDRKEQIAVAGLRSMRITSHGETLRLMRGEFHRHSEVSMDGGSDGTLIDQWRYMIDAGGMDWVGCCDHDNGGGREYSWWTTQKLTDVFYSRGKFVPMFSYERSVAYPEGHRNVIFAQRGIRVLPRLPKSGDNEKIHAPDTQMLYKYLRAFNGIVGSHTSGTNMGTDWRDNDPLTEPVVEIYQGDRQNYEMPGAPRSNSAEDSIGGWRPLGFVNLALEKGYKMSFEASSDHVSTHMSYCNVFAKDGTREAVLDGFQKRHVYGATDDILADFRSGDYMMGDAFSSATPPELHVKLKGTAPFSKVNVIKDNKYVYSLNPGKDAVEFTWRDNAPNAGKMSYYYVRGEQQDGEIVWVSPMWITYTGK